MAKITRSKYHFSEAEKSFFNGIDAFVDAKKYLPDLREVNESLIIGCLITYLVGRGKWTLKNQLVSSASYLVVCKIFKGAGTNVLDVIDSLEMIGYHGLAGVVTKIGEVTGLYDDQHKVNEEMTTSGDNLDFNHSDLNA